MSDEPVAEFMTPLGCKVTVVTAPEHLGAGVLLRLMVDDSPKWSEGRPQIAAVEHRPEDGETYWAMRWAEVYFDPDAMENLRQALWEGLTR